MNTGCSQCSSCNKKFSIYARQFILGLISQRLYLIKTNRSKRDNNPQLTIKAEELRKKFQYQSSDKQIASFIIKNINIIEEMLPVTTSKSYLAQKEKFTKIYTQSNKILNIKYE